METLTIKQINLIVKEHLKNKDNIDFDINKNISLIGWVRTNRDSGRILFISFNDGSRLNSLQVVCKENFTKFFNEAKSLRTGSAIKVTGKIIISENSQQKFEIQASEILLLKQADESYPIQKKEHSLEHLRENSHLRARTNKFYSVMKLRSELAFSIHNFFHLNDFIWVSTPIITANDTEGAGESFSVIAPNDELFFGKSKASLTVSGQLHAEAYALAFKRVYTFGPTFRADKSHTNRHLSEFWMIEPEIAFCDLNQIIFLAETFVKFVMKSILKKCVEEIDLFEKIRNDKLISEGKLPTDYKNIIEKIITEDFKKIEYRDVIKILNNHKNSGIVNFDENNIFFGMDLKSEHERYICEKVFNKPTIVLNYPKDIKAFYMKLNNDNETVASFDLLIPGIGELIGGSQREDDYEKLCNACDEKRINKEGLEWYLNLRKYGYYRSAGFGLGFERLLMFITDFENIKDMISFPRSHSLLKF
ncbi:MAG: asparagine--tRNA ligase [Mycoplasmoidaceae bacterium]